MKTSDFCKICIKTHQDLLICEDICKYLFYKEINDCFVTAGLKPFIENSEEKFYCPYYFEKEMFELNKGELKK